MMEYHILIRAPMLPMSWAHVDGMIPYYMRVRNQLAN
jgi:hypothetical protein